MRDNFDPKTAVRETPNKMNAEEGSQCPGKTITPLCLPRHFDARWFMEVIALAAIYFLTARLGLLLAVPDGHVTPVWPPSGIALAAILLRGRHVWPGIWLGSFTANLWDFYGSPSSAATEIAASVTIGVGASLAALAGALLLRRFVGGRNPLERVRDVCAFMALGGVVSCLISATIGMTTLCLTGFAPWSGFGQTWLTWWLGDTAGVFIVAPLGLVWRGAGWLKSAARHVELFACFGSLFAVTYYVFIGNTTILFTGRPLTFLLIPFLVWPAVRFGQRGAASASGLIALLAVWGTIHNAGPFNLGSRNEALLLLELFLGVVVLTALCMAAMVTEREQAEAAQKRAVVELESRVLERTGALTRSESQARQHLAEAERARAALLSILEDERATEEAREQALSLTRATLESTADGILVVNLEGKIEIFNHVFVKMWRLPDDVLAARDDARALQCVLDQINEPQQFMEKVTYLYAHKEEESYDTLLFKDGRVFDRFSRPQFIGGLVVGRVWSFRDITERTKAEQRLAAFATLGRRLNAVPDAQAAAHIIANLADELFGWDACKLDLYDVQTDSCQSLLTIDIVDGRRQDVSPAYSGESPSPRMRRVMQDGPMLILRENPLAEVNNNWPFGDLNRPSASILFVPVTEGQKVIGALSIQSYKLNAYTQEDLDALQDLTDHCAGALERLRGRDALRASETRFRTIFEQSPLGVAEGVIATGAFVSVNQRFADILGYTTDELRALTFRDYTHPEDLEKDLGKMEKLAAGEIGEFAMEKRYLRKCGGVIWVNITVSSLALPGEKPVNCIAVIDDITARKQAEESLQRSEQLYRQAIAVAGAVPYDYYYLTRQYQYIGEGIELLTGYRPEEICATLWEKITRETIMLGEAAGLSKAAAAQGVLRGEIKQWRSDMRILARDGTSRWLSDVSVQMHDTAGRVIGSRGMLMDITERKQAEVSLKESGEQLRALLKRLQQAQEVERIRVAREIHDELGQMLTGLKMDVRWLERKLAEPSLPPSFHPLLDRAVAASELADQTIAVVQKIAAELRPGALDRLGLGAALAQKARRFQERTGIPCQVTVVESATALSAEIATELFYISQEALTNVTRHAQATEVQIRFEMNDDGVVLEVWDNGRGFTEVDLTTAQSLGLLGMRERAAHCGGTIVWERCEPQGTRLTVRIPCGEALAKTGDSA